MLRRVDTRNAMAAALSRYQRTRCHRLGWTLERFGWALMAAVGLGAAFGIFGGGWLSTVEAAGEGAVSRYPRFGRAHSPLELEVEWVAQQTDTVLSVDRAYLDNFALEEVRPAPLAVTLDSERIHYWFRVSEPDARVVVGLTLRARHGGRFAGSFDVEREPGVGVRHYILP
jgi:hypothetical protein